VSVFSGFDRSAESAPASAPKFEMELRVGKRYRLGRKIGSGSFGDIYLGVDIPTGVEVAIKLESVKTRHPQLHYESKLYRVLAGEKGSVVKGIPQMRWYGVEGNYNVLIMDLLGPSLEDLFNYCGRTFSLQTVCLLALELLDRVEYIHSKNFIHRDIKPDNFLIGTLRKSNTVYAIDFGLAKRYRNPKTMTHIRYREHKHLTGTPRYASVNNHLGIEQSRRDDLESLGFVLMYFLRGSLPWQGLRANTKKQKYQKILEKKLATPFRLLCKNFPREFVLYLEYCRQLRFEDEPDYKYLRGLFEAVLRAQKDDDRVFDWVKRKFKENNSGGSGKAGKGGDADAKATAAAAPGDSRRREASGRQEAGKVYSRQPAARESSRDARNRTADYAAGGSGAVGASGETERRARRASRREARPSERVTTRDRAAVGGTSDRRAARRM